MSLRWLILSAITPPNRLRQIAGIPEASPMYPIYNLDPVMSYINHPWANKKIWNPVTDPREPIQNFRKSGELKTEKT